MSENENESDSKEDRRTIPSSMQVNKPTQIGAAIASVVLVVLAGGNYYIGSDSDVKLDSLIKTQKQVADLQIHIIRNSSDTKYKLQRINDKLSQFKDIIREIDETRVKKSDFNTEKLSKEQRDRYIDEVIRSNSKDHEELKLMIYSPFNVEEKPNRWRKKAIEK